MKYLSLILAFGFLFFQSLEAQNNPEYKAMMDDHSFNFYEVVESAEAYFQNIDIYKKGSGWKPYQRWKATNEYKYYPDGDRSIVDPNLVSKSYTNFKAKNPENKSLLKGWNDLGPYSIDNITGHYAAGLGRIDAFHVDEDDANLVYLGSRSGGFWKTTNGGFTWQGGSTDFLESTGVDHIAVSPTNPDSIFINLRNSRDGNSKGIYRSIDGGDTWQISNFNPVNVGYGGLGDNLKIQDIQYHPRIPNLIFIGTNEGLYRSTDNLATWTRTETSKDIREFGFHPINDNVIYMYDNYYWNSSNHNFIFRSTNGGITFTKSNEIVGNNGNRNAEIVTINECPNCVYFASSSGVWVSKNNGLDFTYLSNPSTGPQGFAVSDVDSSQLIYGYVDMYASSDGGRNFTQKTYWSLGNTNGAGSGHQASFQNSTNYIHADADEADCVNGVFYVATDGFLNKSEDNGETWERISSGIGIRENYKLGTSQSNHYRTACGSQDNGASIYTENGWIEFYGADGMENIIHPLNDDWMITSLQNGGRRRTKDGGMTQGGATPSGSNSGQWEAPIAYDPLNQMTIYDFRDKVYKSTDFGSTHTELGSPVSFTGTIQDAAIAENNSDIILISTGGKLDKSIDGGVSFVEITGTLPNYDIQDIAFDPKDDNTIIVVYGRYQDDGQKVYKSTDGGTTWQNITHNLSDMPIRSVVIDHDDAKNIYLGAELGVFTMPIVGTNWVAYNTNLPNMTVEELEICYGSNTLKAATWGRGLWEFDLVGRTNFPKIIKTRISNQPTDISPKEGIDQYVISNIDYEGILEKVELLWSLGTPTLNNVINMSNEFGNVYKSVTSIPSQLEGEKVYFQVKVTSLSLDVTMSYTFMYETREYTICGADGDSNSGNLFIDNVTLANLNNSSGNTDYIEYTSPVISLTTNQAYTIDVSANTSWNENDFAVWIDYNNDGDFGDEERILYDVNSGSDGTNTFFPRADAVFNTNLKMRVRLAYWGSNPAPCGTTLGEVEDYLVTIADGGCGIVENISDAGAGSLRSIVDCTSDGGNIVFSDLLDGQTIVIDSDPLNINKSLIFESTSGRYITIASIQPQISTLSSVMSIRAGETVTIKNLTIRGAYGLEGSGILNAGDLILEDTKITNGGKIDVTSTVKNIGAGTIRVDSNSEID